mmetsp:Transcript_12380/g.37766  ORF Transcript_12380/g.37766 Transcript_12380/m.37766 type:complete len:215 (+) Transcript_12380:645-1289(+)
MRTSWRTTQSTRRNLATKKSDRTSGLLRSRKRGRRKYLMRRGAKSTPRANRRVVMTGHSLYSQTRMSRAKLEMRAAVMHSGFSEKLFSIFLTAKDIKFWMLVTQRKRRLMRMQLQIQSSTNWLATRSEYFQKYQTSIWPHKRGYSPCIRTRQSSTRRRSRHARGRGPICRISWNSTTRRRKRATQGAKRFLPDMYYHLSRCDEILCETVHTSGI